MSHFLSMFLILSLLTDVHQDIPRREPPAAQPFQVYRRIQQPTDIP